jgi:WD40 repeat protein
LRLNDIFPPKLYICPTFGDAISVIDVRQVVSAISVDPSGARIATGSHDYDTKLWDFGGMDARLKPFKSFEANGNYHVSWHRFQTCSTCAVGAESG